MVIGVTFSVIFALIWMYTLGITFYLKGTAYIYGRPAMRTEYLRLLLKSFTDDDPYMYHEEKKVYNDLDLDYRLALTGDNVAGIIFFGALIVLCTILFWPVTLLILILRGLRRYNTDEEFHELFERKKVTRPRKIPKSHPRKVIKGLD